MLAKKWLVKACDKDKAAQIAQEYSLSPFAALLAVSRGITEPEQTEEFFFPSDVEPNDPFEIADMDLAVERLGRAIDQNEKIAVVGDYDADGVTSTVLMCRFLKSQNADFIHYIPNRLEEGYGLSIDIIDKLREEDVSLILTVDNGISCVDEVDYASGLGIDTIITDHHIPGDVLPKAVAVVDPHRENCPSAFKDYAGVGVAFKLVCAMLGDDDSSLLDDFAELVSIGTIGDIVPLKGENRTIVKSGVKMLNENPSPGVRALVKTAGFEGKALSAMNVAFTIAPRLNAVGRMGSAERAFELLMSESVEQALSIAADIEDANVNRQKTEARVTELVEKQLRTSSLRYDRVIVCSGEGWHSGVIGIVASRIVERYGKPCIIISSDGEKSKGSGRSLPDFSLFDALSSCSDILDAFGGHKLAAGVSLRTDRIDEFRKRINEYAARDEMPFPVLNIDFRLNPKSVSPELVNALLLMEPFGAGNPQPVFGLFKMRIDKITPVGGGKHLRLGISRSGTKLTAMKFSATLDSFPFTEGSTADLAVTLDMNEYLGESRVNIHIKDMRFSSFESESVLSGIRIYETLMRGERPTAENAQSLIPDRDIAGAIYRLIKSTNGWKRSEAALCAQTGHLGEDVCSVLLALDIMEERGLISRDSAGNISLLETSGKVDLNDSPILRSVKRITEADEEELF